MKIVEKTEKQADLLSAQVQNSRPTEKTLEETIKDIQDSINLLKERNLNNIQKIEARAAAASGEEKTRLEGLLQLHMNHKIELEGKDATAEGTTKFNERAARLNK